MVTREAKLRSNLASKFCVKKMFHLAPGKGNELSLQFTCL